MGREKERERWEERKRASGVQPRVEREREREKGLSEDDCDIDSRVISSHRSCPPTHTSISQFEKKIPMFFKALHKLMFTA